MEQWGDWERKNDSTVRAWTRADEPRRLWNFSFLVSWTDSRREEEVRQKKRRERERPTELGMR